jgi:hypothetical protein
MTKMRLLVDGMLSGTGIRDALNGGYIKPSALSISSDLQARIAGWLARYENAHFYDYANKNEVRELDEQGLEITRLLRDELSDADVGYFSNANMQRLEV